MTSRNPNQTPYPSLVFGDRVLLPDGSTVTRGEHDRQLAAIERSAPAAPTEACATGSHDECVGWCSCPCHPRATPETSIVDDDLVQSMPLARLTGGDNVVELAPTESPLAGLMKPHAEHPGPGQPFEWVEDTLMARATPGGMIEAERDRRFLAAYLPARDFAGPVPIEDGTEARAAENGMGC